MGVCTLSPVMGSWLQRGKAEPVPMCICACVWGGVSDASRRHRPYTPACLRYSVYFRVVELTQLPHHRTPTWMPSCPTFNGILNLSIFPLPAVLITLRFLSGLTRSIRYEDGIRPLPRLKISPTFCLMSQQGSPTLAVIRI